MTPPPSLRVWVCPNCATTLTELGAGRHECPACEAAVLNRPVEYLPATDLEQLREALRELADAAEPVSRFVAGHPSKHEARFAAALSRACNLLAGGSDEA